MKHLDLFRRFGLRTTIAPSLQGVGPSRPGWFRALPLAASFILLTAPLRGEFAYVANVKSNTVSAYSIGSNGALTPVSGSPLRSGCNWRDRCRARGKAFLTEMHFCF